MKTIRVSDATYREIVALAMLPFQHTGSRTAAGWSRSRTTPPHASSACGSPASATTTW